MTTAPRPADESSNWLEEVESFLATISESGDVVEVRLTRGNKYGQTASGYFDDLCRLAKSVFKFDGRANAYITVNPVTPDLLARSNNRIKESVQHTTSDGDIPRRRWFGIDIDPDRASGISSTDAELDQAAQVLENLRTGLSLRGWTDPVVVMSGNGYWALYRIDLPNDPNSANLLKGVLDALGNEFDTASAHVDRTVYNAGRIMPLPGTLKVKGDATVDRPHRRVRLVDVPNEIVVVTESQLQEIAVTKVVGAQDTSASDNDAGRTVRGLEDILMEHGVEFQEQSPDSNGITWYHVDQCPFHDDGRPFECGVGQQLSSGKYAGHCFHPEGDGKGWQEWKRALGIDVNSKADTTGEGASGEFPTTDAGNAELFAKLYGAELRFDHRRGKWLTCPGHHWEEDRDGLRFRRGKELARMRIRMAADFDDRDKGKKWAKWGFNSESLSRINATLSLAKNEYPIADPGDLWDVDTSLLGVGNGVVDLRTGALRPARPQDRILLHSDVPYDPGATCPRFQSFLQEIFDGDKELVSYVRAALGYSITGSTREQVFFVCYGNGSNGKTNLHRIIARVLGSYSYNLPFSSLERGRQYAIPTDLAGLVGQRFVTTSESDEMARLNEARLKALTGQDPVTARFLNQDFFQFDPVAKFWLAVNLKPEISDDSYGFKRKLRLIPFKVRFAVDHEPRADCAGDHRHADRNLDSALWKERKGILALLVKEAMRWYETGLRTPESVIKPTEEYLDESNDFGSFIYEVCVEGPDYSVTSGEIYGLYLDWAKREECWEAVKQNALLEFPDHLKSMLGESNTSVAQGGKRGGTRITLSAGGQTQQAAAEIKQCEDLGSDYFWALAVWGRETKVLDNFQRRLCGSVARRMQSGSLPTYKQARIVVEAIKEAERQGFQFNSDD